MKKLPEWTRFQDFLFLDYERLSLYYEQIPENKVHTAREVTLEARLSMTGPSVKRVETRRQRQASVTEQIDAIREHLQRQNDIGRAHV